MTNQSKTYRKFFATAATATLVATAVTPAAAASFTDVSDKYQDAVDFLVSKGANGLTETSFGVNKEIKRVDAAVLLANVLELDTENAPESGFTDVPARAQAAVNALKEAKITNGKTATKFDGDSLITRGELAIWIQRGFELEGSADLNFSDVSDRYEEAVKALVEHEITNGVSATKFGVEQQAKRGDFAIFLHRANLAIETPETPEVVEVSAINPTTIEVEFNKEIAKDTVAIGDFAINNVALTAPNYSVELSEDGKTATIFLANANKLEVDKSYAVKVSGVEDTEGNDLVAVTNYFVFADETAATVTEVNAKTGSIGTTDTVEVVFSENIDENTTANQFRVNDMTPDSIIVNKNVATLTLPAAIEMDETHELRVVDVADLSANKTNATEKFTVETDTTAPVASVEVKDENTVVVSFDEAVTAVTAANVKILNGNVNVTGAVGSLSEDGKSVEVDVNSVIYADDATSADLTAEVTAVEDIFGNVSKKSTHSVTITKDVTAPTVTKVEGLEDTNTFVISFSEQLDGDAGDVVTAPTLFKDNVKLVVEGAVLKADENGEVTQVEVTTAADLTDGTYQLTVEKDTVTDTSLAANTNVKVTKSFTATSPDEIVDEVKPVVSGIEVSGDVLTVTFADNDQTDSALDYSNYKLNGKVISEDANLYFNGDKNVVKIELPTGYFIADQSNVIVDIVNIADADGNVMDKYTKTDLVVIDTKAPVLTDAKITADNQFVLTFNEDISTNVDSFTAAKVIIKDSEGEVVTGITAGATAVVTDENVTITLADDKSFDLDETYTVSVEAGVGLVDQADTNNDATGVEVAAFENINLVDGVAPVLAAGDYFANDLFANTTIGITAPAVATIANEITSADLSEEFTSAKLVYADNDENTADVEVNGTLELNAAQDAYTLTFGTANLSTLVAGDITVKLVLVDEDGNESVGYDVVADGTGTAATTLKLVK